MTLVDTGVRDEHGMEPADHLFSSPEKGETNGRASGRSESGSDDEQDMEIDDGMGAYLYIIRRGNPLENLHKLLSQRRRWDPGRSRA